jgi:hypothetical protein
MFTLTFSLFMYTNKMYTGSYCVHVCYFDNGAPLSATDQLTGCRPSPLPLRVARQVKIIERCSQTISKLGHAALLRRCELQESAELTQGAITPRIKLASRTLPRTQFRKQGGALHRDTNLRVLRLY